MLTMTEPLSQHSSPFKALLWPACIFVLKYSACCALMSGGCDFHVFSKSVFMLVGQSADFSDM